MRQTYREYPWKTTKRNAVIDPNKIKDYFYKKGTFKKYQKSNLFAQHPEYDLYEGMKQLNLMDNGSNMVGKENVWSK